MAGLDAGLVYNTFPLMGGQLVPEGMFVLKPWWKNFFENVTTVQFDHRVLVGWMTVFDDAMSPRSDDDCCSQGVTTVTAISGLYVVALCSAKQLQLSRSAKLACHSLFAMSLLQVSNTM